jgi:hypothetical protein
MGSRDISRFELCTLIITPIVFLFHLSKARYSQFQFTKDKRRVSSDDDTDTSYVLLLLCVAASLLKTDCAKLLFIRLRTIL